MVQYMKLDQRDIDKKRKNWLRDCTAWARETYGSLLAENDEDDLGTQVRKSSVAFRKLSLKYSRESKSSRAGPEPPLYHRSYTRRACARSLPPRSTGNRWCNGTLRDSAQTKSCPGRSEQGGIPPTSLTLAPAMVVDDTARAACLGCGLEESRYTHDRKRNLPSSVLDQFGADMWILGDPWIWREFHVAPNAITTGFLAPTDPALSEKKPRQAEFRWLWPPRSRHELVFTADSSRKTNTYSFIAIPILLVVLLVSSSKTRHGKLSIKSMGRFSLLTIGILFLCTANANGQFVQALLTGISAATSLGTGIFSYQIADKPAWSESWKISLTTIAAVAELGFFWGYVAFFLAGFRGTKQLAFFRTFRAAIVVTGIRLVWSLASSTANADTSNKWLNELVLLIWGTTVLAVCAAESSKVGEILGHTRDESSDAEGILDAATDAVVGSGGNA